MTTVINTPASAEKADSSAGWLVAVIILLAVIAAGTYYWVNRATPEEKVRDTNVTVVVPTLPVPSEKTSVPK